MTKSADIGKRCHFSSTAKRMFRRPERQGVIVGESKERFYGSCWYVLWDGLKMPQAYNKDFIIVVVEGGGT